MNKAQEIGLKFAAAFLSRAEERKNLREIASAHSRIKKTLISIYKGKIDVPAVLRVEQILNDGLANVLGKAHWAYDHIEMLASQTESGLKLHKKFTKDPQTYVEYAEATRENVAVRGILIDGVANDPVRYALATFRNELVTDLTNKAGDPFRDREQTNRMRYNAMVEAERGYLEKFLDNIQYLEEEEREEKKARCLARFDNRIKKEARKIEPEYTP